MEMLSKSIWFGLILYLHCFHKNASEDRIKTAARNLFERIYPRFIYSLTVFSKMLLWTSLRKADETNLLIAFLGFFGICIICFSSADSVKYFVIMFLPSDNLKMKTKKGRAMICLKSLHALNAWSKQYSPDLIFNC